MRDLLNTLRRAIEAALPWYDAEHDAERTRHVATVIREADKQRLRLMSYNRTRLH